MESCLSLHHSHPTALPNETIGPPWHEQIYIFSETEHALRSAPWAQESGFENWTFADGGCFSSNLLWLTKLLVISVEITKNVAIVQ